MSSKEQEQSLKQRYDLRSVLSNFLCLVAISYLTILLLVWVYMWLYAWQHNLYPRVPLVKNAYRGPWSHDFTLVLLGNQTFLLPVSASFFALLSCIIKPNKRAGLAILVSVVLFVVQLGLIGLLED